MHIISKFKDYYDYLKGIYGVDSKLVLDRTSFFNMPYKPMEGQKLVFFICGKVVECLYAKGDFHYGEDIKLLSEAKSWWNNYQYGNTCFKLEDENTDLNDKMNCPILLRWYGSNEHHDVEKFPILKQYDFIKAMDAHTIWIKLSEWLAREKLVINTQTDKEKITSHGFDTKTSFRH